jgi:hypothetical protein
VKKVRNANAQSKITTLATVSTEIFDRLHKLSFLPVTDILLRKTHMLDNADGLPQLFDKFVCGGVDWPWYLGADAEELYNKWCMRVFETDLYRGLDRAMRGKAKSSSSAYDRLEEGSERYRLVDPNNIGMVF